MKFSRVSLVGMMAALGGCTAPPTTHPAANAPVQAAIQTVQTPVAATVATAPAPAGTSPEVIAALAQLTSEDFKTRQAAAERIERAIAANFRNMLQAQEIVLKGQQSLAKQLEHLTGVNDADAVARVHGLIEFNYSLSRWALETAALPEEKRKAMLEWGLTPEHCRLIAQAWHRREEVRAQAAREVAKMTDEKGSWILAQLIVDPSREVSLAAMESTIGRKNSPMIIDALWEKSMSNFLQNIRPRVQRYRNVTFRGRPIQVYETDYAGAGRYSDPELATEILIELKPQELTDKLNAIFDEAMSSYKTNPNDYRWRNLWPTYNYSGHMVWRLADAVKPKSALPYLGAMLSVAGSDGSTTTIGNNERVRYSSRIDIAAAFIRFAGSDPDDLNLRKYPNAGYSDRYMLSTAPNGDGIAEETELLRMLQAWWKEQQPKYEAGEKLPALKASGVKSKPAATKAAGAPADQPDRVMAVPAMLKTR